MILFAQTVHTKKVVSQPLKKQSQLFVVPLQCKKYFCSINLSLQAMTATNGLGPLICNQIYWPMNCNYYCLNCTFIARVRQNVFAWTNFLRNDRRKLLLLLWDLKERKFPISAEILAKCDLIQMNILFVQFMQLNNSKVELF